MMELQKLQNRLVLDKDWWWGGEEVGIGKKGQWRGTFS